MNLRNEDVGIIVSTSIVHKSEESERGWAPCNHSQKNLGWIFCLI